VPTACWARPSRWWAAEDSVGETLPHRQAAGYPRACLPQVPRRLGGDGGLDREAFAPECGDDDAGLARAGRRDLAGGRAADQRYGGCALPQLRQQGRQVVRLRAEDDQQLRVVTDERVVQRPRPGSRIEAVGGANRQPSSRLHNPYQSQTRLHPDATAAP